MMVLRCSATLPVGAETNKRLGLFGCGVSVGLPYATVYKDLIHVDAFCISPISLAL